jgi:hypothetical protein
MRPKDWFGVGVRLLGVWELLECLDEIRMAAEAHLGLLPLRTPLATYFVHGAADLVVGIYLLMGAPLLLSFAFSRHNEALCGNCGYDLTGNVSGKCPECGMPTTQKPAP